MAKYNQPRRIATEWDDKQMIYYLNVLAQLGSRANLMKQIELT